MATQSKFGNRVWLDLELPENKVHSSQHALLAIFLPTRASRQTFWVASALGRLQNCCSAPNTECDRRLCRASLSRLMNSRNDVWFRPSVLEGRARLLFQLQRNIWRRKLGNVDAHYIRWRPTCLVPNSILASCPARSPSRLGARGGNTRDPKYIATDQNSESTKHGKWSIKVILPLANRRIILQFFNP